MPRIRAAIGREVADQINHYETAIDHALATGGRLLDRLIQARIEARVAASVGHAAIEKLLTSISRLVEARTAGIAQHDCLEQTRTQLNVPKIAGGHKVPDLSDPGGISNGETQEPMRLAS